MNERPVIQDVTCDDIPAVLDFVLEARSELFPKLSAAGMPTIWRDLKRCMFMATASS